MVSLEELRDVREAELRLARAHVALCDVLLDHAAVLDLDGLRLEVSEWDGKLALSLGLVDPPRALPAPAQSGSKASAWSDDEDAQILRLASDGLGVKAIAAKLSRPWQAVGPRLKKLRQAEPDPAPEAEPEPAPEPAQPVPKSGDWSDGEDMLILELRADGLAVEEIAAKTGRGSHAVAFRLEKLLAADPVLGAKAQAYPHPALEPGSDPAPLSAAFHLDMYGLTSARDRAAEDRLRAIGYPDPFTPKGDLALVEALGRGDGIGAAAAAAGVVQGLAKMRWKALLPEVTVENQAALLTVLRARAALAAA